MIYNTVGKSTVKATDYYPFLTYVIIGMVYFIISARIDSVNPDIISMNEMVKIYHPAEYATLRSSSEKTAACFLYELNLYMRKMEITILRT